MPTSCSLLSIGILVYDHFGRVNLLTVVLATTMLLAVVVRLGITFRENHRLYELARAEAVTTRSPASATAGSCSPTSSAGSASLAPSPRSSSSSTSTA